MNITWVQRLSRKITPIGRRQAKYEHDVALWDIERHYLARKARIDAECADCENIHKWRISRLEADTETARNEIKR